MKNLAYVKKRKRRLRVECDSTPPPFPPHKKQMYAEFSDRKKHNSSRCGLCTLFELLSWKCYSPGHPEFSGQPLQLLLSHGSDQLRFHVRFLVFQWFRVWNLWKLLDLLSSSTLLKQKYIPSELFWIEEKHLNISEWNQNLNFKNGWTAQPKHSWQWV